MEKLSVRVARRLDRFAGYGFSVDGGFFLDVVSLAALNLDDALEYACACKATGDTQSIAIAEIIAEVCERLTKEESYAGRPTRGLV